MDNSESKHKISKHSKKFYKLDKNITHTVFLQQYMILQWPLLIDFMSQIT